MNNAKGLTMNIHVIEESLFFRASIPVGDQQRLLVIPPGKGLSVGDTVFLRDADGRFKWVADVVFKGETEGPEVWDGAPEARAAFAVLGWLARIHQGVLPPSRARFQANWVLLNRRTIATALPWWDEGVLVYHSTLHLVEGICSRSEVEQGEALGCLQRHPSGHWLIPHGEARKRFLVQVRNVPLVCGLCGAPIASLEEATQDHVIPVSQGGPDTMSNVQLAHRVCNEVKGNALPEQYPAFFVPPLEGDAAAGVGRGGRGRRRTPAAKGRGRAASRPAGLPAAAAVASAAATPPAQPTVVAALTAAAKARGGAAAAGAGDVAAAAVQAGETKESKPEAKKKVVRKGRTKVESVAAGGEEENTAWLETVQRSTWSRLLALASERGWASRTAELRTLQQLRRGQVSKALSEGITLAEAGGPAGRFRMLDWKGQTVLVEGEPDSQVCHLVRMLDAMTPDVYVAYLARFGLAAPLTVAMALMAACNQGTTDGEGRISCWRGDQPLLLRIENDRITECALPEDTQVA